MNTFIRTGPRIEPGGTLLLTGHQPVLSAPLKQQPLECSIPGEIIRNFNKKKCLQKMSILQIQGRGKTKKKKVWDTIKPPIFSILSSGNFENPELLKKQAIYKITR